MDTKNIIAAISLSAAVIILYGLFFAPTPQDPKLTQKNTSTNIEATNTDAPSLDQNDETIKNTEGLKKLIDHIDIINKDMITIFKKNNIEPIKAINEKLDPNLHQAMMEVEDDTKDQGTIVQEIQKGFMMKDRLLRPSLVAVSKKKDEAKEKDKKSMENNEKIDKN